MVYMAREPLHGNTNTQEHQQYLLLLIASVAGVYTPLLLLGHKIIHTKRKKKPLSVFTPSCVTSVGSSWIEKYAEQV